MIMGALAAPCEPWKGYLLVAVMAWWWVASRLVALSPHAIADPQPDAAGSAGSW